MKQLTAVALAVAMTATAGAASAQQYSAYPSGYQGSQGGYYDYARVIRVDPVYDYGRNDRYAASTGGERCTESRTYAGGGYRDGYYEDRYGGYRDDRYDDRYRYGGRPDHGSQAGGTAATVIGGIVGAVIGSQVGGGSARYATSAIGSMVGGIAGRQIYEQGRRERYDTGRVGRVVACDPVPVDAYASRRASMYDVTYEYGGRRQVTRMSYDPGDRVRVRVDVRAE